MLEFNYHDPRVKVYADGEKSPTILGEIADTGVDYLSSFFADIAGTPTDLNTENVIAATRMALEIQAAGDARG